MKGKKCIGLLILFITCLLSLSHFSNAEAIENIGARSITSIQYNLTNQGIITKNTNYSMIDEINFNPNYNSQQIITDVIFNFSSPFNITNNDKFKINIYFQSETENNSYIFSSPVCPEMTSASAISIDDCVIEHIDRETYFNEIIQYPTSNQSYPYTYSPNNLTYNYYSMTIYAHNKVGTLSLGRFTTQGPLFFVYNTNTSSNPLIANLKLRMYIGQMVFYVEDRTPEDEVAEKELEDRDNIESQQTDTENEASEEGESAEETGTSLFSAFTQFVSALTNVSGSSCILPNMQIYSLDLGQMDLCTYNIPPQIMALVSIGMVFIIVPLGIHLVKKMLNLYKEITG